MMQLWSEWWVWAAAAIALAIGEVLLPGYILLGFGGGAALIAILFAVGGPFSAWMAGSLPITLLAFAVFSLISWWLLRRFLGVRKGQVKYIDHDINE